MPLYEYKCEKCGTFDKIQKFSDNPLTECPHCLEKGLKSKVERLISESAFHLKGGGWYGDLYSKGGGSKKEATSDKKSESTEAKPAAETATKKGCGTGCACH